jgi:hypothetical protein
MTMVTGLEALFEDLRALQAGICPACGEALPAARAYLCTCSDACHRAWIDHLVARHGDTKEITHLETGTVYLVPTRVILERGISGRDLPRFPEKGRPSITCPACQRVSYNPHDVMNRYCGACHRFHDDPAPPGASHV